MQKVAFGKYAEVKSLLSQFEENHFGSLCGAKRAVKPETAQKIKTKKVNTVWRILKWMVDDSGIGFFLIYFTGVLIWPPMRHLFLL